ncbi:hypothetical protein C8Q75DRAFT_731591 [Abortiporus biennis]|nr:hypothetical protein C8Q75DRAFT_731591 [Abortiporus biennis]
MFQFGSQHSPFLSFEPSALGQFASLASDTVGESGWVPFQSEVEIPATVSLQEVEGEGCYATDFDLTEPTENMAEATDEVTEWTIKWFCVLKKHRKCEHKPFSDRSGCVRHMSGSLNRYYGRFIRCSRCPKFKTTRVNVSNKHLEDKKCGGTLRRDKGFDLNAWSREENERFLRSPRKPEARLVRG